MTRAAKPAEKNDVIDVTPEALDLRLRWLDSRIAHLERMNGIKASAAPEAKDGE